ncbi:hypothetical protein [Yersinia pekkanenii]|nr:hypothetical protein [Yersinia pekkanenii]
MRWLFALFIAVSGWTGSVSGNLLSPTYSPSSAMALSVLSAIYPDNHPVSDTPSTVSVFSSYLRLQNKIMHSQYRQIGVPVKKTAIKNRLSVAKFAGSTTPTFANNTGPGAYLTILRSNRADDIYKQPRQSLPLLNYANWMFHTSTQQNRVGGWKESNIQYSGMLTYPPKGVIISLLS